MNSKVLNILIIIALLGALICVGADPLEIQTKDLVVEGSEKMLANGTDSPEFDFASMDEYVLSEMKKASIPGLAYGIVKGDQIVHLQAFGVADTSGRPVTPQTPFVIGSVAKTFTALAIRQLINDGQIELDAPVQLYIPWFQLADPEASGQITINHLLSHTSGLSHADGNQAVFFDERYTIEELVRRMDSIHLNRPVGSSEEYSNLNFLLLGEVVQMVAGQHFADYVKTKIFAPLEMKHSFLSKPDAVRDGLATGYHIWYGFPMPMQAAFPKGAASHGYVISSAEDLAHYLVAYLNRGSYHRTSLLVPVGSSVSSQPANWYDIYWNEHFGSNDRYSQAQSGGTYNFNSVIQILGDQSQGTYGIVVLMNTRPDMLVETVNAMSISEGISSLLLHGSVEKTSELSSIEWYLWWGLVDLGLLALLLLALFELFTFRKWTHRISGASHLSLPAFFMRTGMDLLAGIFALIALPLWLGLPWRDLLKPFCELCPILILSGILLSFVAVGRILLLILKIGPFANFSIKA